MNLVYRVYPTATRYVARLEDIATGRIIADGLDERDAEAIIEAFRLIHALADWPANDVILWRLQESAQRMLKKQASSFIEELIR